MASVGYTSASVLSSTDRIAATNGSGEWHSWNDRKTLIAQSRDFYRNNPLYKGMIDRCVGYIIGNGFSLQARTQDATWNAKAEALWRAWWQSPEVRGLFNGSRVESLVCREWIVAGDALALKLDSGLIQLVEAEQVDGPKYQNGVNVDENGRPISYRVCQYDKRGAAKSSTGIDHPAASVLFVVDPERPTSVRGIPACQSAFPMLHRINDVCDSEAIAWQMLSRLAIAVNRKDGPAAAFAESEDDGQGKGVAERVIELEQGIIWHGEPGEEVRGIDRNIPGQNFPEALRMFARLFGLPLGVPLEVIFLDWTNSNYSQSRAVLEQAFTTFAQRQDLLEERFYSPLYEWKMRTWIASGALPANPDAFRHEWITPSWPWIDQLKEVQAFGAKMDRGITTLSSVCKALNTEREEVVGARVKEIEDAIQKAQALEARYGVPVPWQIFAGMEPPQNQPAPTFNREVPDDSDQ